MLLMFTKVLYRNVNYFKSLSFKYKRPHELFEYDEDIVLFSVCSSECSRPTLYRVGLDLASY